MLFDVSARDSDAPGVASVMWGRTMGVGTVVRPAETHWHMVFVRAGGRDEVRLTGPWLSSAPLAIVDGVELLWIQFELGAYMPHLPTATFADRELVLPAASASKFWLHGSAWEFPTPESADVFVARLLRAETLVRDGVVATTLRGETQDVATRTLRHRFVHSTGMSQAHLRQIERAQRAAALLRHGVAILDVVAELGFYDQPHLTRSLKQLVGYAPAELSKMC